MPQMRHRLLILGALAFVMLWLAAMAGDGARRWVARTDLPPLVTRTGQIIEDQNGQMLRAYQVGDGRWRLDVGLAQVDPAFIAGLIAYEDKRFYRHHGVDLRAGARAAAQAVRHGRVVAGGSTLTMQVARLLEDGPTGTWHGKLRQVRVALALEQRLSKDEILAQYLLRAPYGGNLEGVRAASLAWFAKEPHRLTPAQVALLIALPQSPAARRPDRAPDLARIARNRVIDRLQARGLLTAQAAITARQAPLPTQRRAFPALAPHLADRLRAAQPDQGRITTTLDARLQQRIELLAQRAIAERRDADLSIAIVIADHTSGAVLASVGSPAYADARHGYVDMTRALRSPGSTLKPLVYGLAFDQGLAHPDTLIEDRPTRFGTYAPQNFDGAYRGTISLRAALTQSLNIPVVSLTEAIGPARLMAHLKRSGAQPQLPSADAAGLAVALGGVGISLHDMVQLYAGLAQGGRAVRLSALAGEAAPAAHFLAPEAAWHVGHILGNIPPPAGAPRNGLAYKTGTSYGHRDAWALGYDGQHVAGVWIGRADGTPVPGAFGGAVAAPVLFEAFARLKPALTPPPPPPAGTLLGPDLPAPLQAFKPRDALFRAAADAPQVAFPPDGALLAATPLFVAKVARGAPPFVWMVNGAPQPPTHERQISLPAPVSGFVRLSVIDAQGRAARAQVRVEP